MFQSSPALSDGRYNGVKVLFVDYQEFQSSPALSDGRYDAPEPQTGVYPCFNPRPPFRTGATTAGVSADAAKEVSILARPFGRALQYTEQGI